MSNLLNLVVEAHGGLAQWNQFTDLVTDVFADGELCRQRNWSGIVPRSRLLLSLRTQRTVVLLPAGQGHILIRPDLISHTDEHGAYLESLAHPRETMLRENSPMDWDLLRTAYFIGSAIRHSVTAPFLYTLPGFISEEVEPWEEDGETWRVLRILFPADFGAPASLHFAYYGPDGRLRRTRNGIEMIGGLNLAEYVTSYEQIDGIWMPTSNEVFACDPEGRKLDRPPLGRIAYVGSFLTN
ncbi:hypothetical protein [Silvibacterium sp.]|uniref:hypothetical protein n=1 Tax=Silvibacterium sp. TaxID=1964179 RepID=UPI0039E4A1E3